MSLETQTSILAEHTTIIIDDLRINNRDYGQMRHVGTYLLTLVEVNCEEGSSLIIFL